MLKWTWRIPLTAIAVLVIVLLLAGNDFGDTLYYSFILAGAVTLPIGILVGFLMANGEKSRFQTAQMQYAMWASNQKD